MKLIIMSRGVGEEDAAMLLSPQLNILSLMLNNTEAVDHHHE